MEKWNESGPFYGNHWNKETKKERDIVRDADVTFYLVDSKFLLSF
jgi:hypothetical protein